MLYLSFDRYSARVVAMRADFVVGFRDVTMNYDRLLVVDADKGIRDYFSAVAEDVNYNVARATDEHEMKRRLSDFSPSTVLLGFDGSVADAAGKLKLLVDTAPEVTVIFLCDVDRERLETVTALGELLGLRIDGTIQKPVPVDYVRNKLRMARKPVQEATPIAVVAERGRR